jgi:putative membrane protein
MVARLFTTAADPASVGFTRNRLLQGLTAAYVLWWLVLAIAPYDRFDWLLENLLVFLFVGLLAATYRRFPLSDLSYLLIAAFLALHAVGAHYTYSKAPVGGWMTEALGWERNHYDRAVHFLFGLLCAYPLRETVMRSCRIGGWRAGILAFAVVLAFSSAYEMLEWGVAIILSPEEAMAFLGTQGDVFDAQKDSTLAAAGATLSLMLLPFLERRRRPAPN